MQKSDGFEIPYSGTLTKHSFLSESSEDLKKFLFLNWFLFLVLLQTVPVWAQIKNEEDSSLNIPV